MANIRKFLKKDIIENIIAIAFMIMLIVVNALGMDVLGNILIIALGILIIVFRKRLARSMTKQHLRIAKRKKSPQKKLELIESVGNKIFLYISIIAGVFFVIFGVLNLLNVI